MEQTKSLNIDIILPWEIGLIIVILGFIIVIVGVRQSKKKFEDFDKYPFIKPSTKIFFGSVACIFGAIQMLPLLKL